MRPIHLSMAVLIMGMISVSFAGELASPAEVRIKLLEEQLAEALRETKRLQADLIQMHTIVTKLQSAVTVLSQSKQELQHLIPENAQLRNQIDQLTKEPRPH